MATIAQIVAQIRTAIYGKDVRENIAQGIEKCYSDVTASETLADAAATRANTAALRSETINSELGDNADDLVIVSQTQPSLSKEFNKVWVKPDGREYQVPTWEEFEDVKSAMNDVTSSKQIVFTSGNIDLSTTAGNVVPSLVPSPVSGWRCAVVDCDEYDVFLLNCKGGSSPRAYAFLTEDNKMLAGKAASGLRATDLIVIAPKTAKKIVINDNNTNGICYHGYLPFETDQIEYTVIQIRGVGRPGTGNTGVTATNEYYVHSTERLLKKVVSYTSATSMTDVTVPFNKNTLYLYDNKLYKCNADGDTFDDLILTNNYDSEISGIESDIEEIKGNLDATEISFIENGNISIGNYNIGDVVSLTPEPNNSWIYAIVECKEYDTFVLNCKGGNAPRAYAFLSANNELISRAASGKTLTNFTISAPKNAAKIVINDNKTYGVCTIDSTKINESLSIATVANSRSELNYADQDKIIGEDSFLSVINGKKWSDELINNRITDFKKDGDLMVHVSTFTIVDGIVYVTYYANRTHSTETPTEHIARFVYCALNDVNNKTYIDLQSVGDTFDGQTVSAIYDTILMRKDSDTLFLMWTARIGSEYARLYKTFTISTGTLSETAYNYFKCGNETETFNVSGVETALAANSIKHTALSGDIGIMQKLSTREENGTVYYYTGCYADYFNCIIKSSDLITWEFVACPDFANEMQWENAVYVRGNKAFYFVRQIAQRNAGLLMYYDLNAKTWTKPVFVNDAQSRSDFFVYDNVLYLLHAPKDRNHFGIMQVNESCLGQSVEIQTADISLSFYPYILPIGNEFYISYTQNRKHIYLTKFTVLGSKDGMNLNGLMSKIQELFLS